MIIKLNQTKLPLPAKAITTILKLPDSTKGIHLVQLSEPIVYLSIPPYDSYVAK